MASTDSLVELKRPAPDPLRVCALGGAYVVSYLHARLAFFTSPPLLSFLTTPSNSLKNVVLCLVHLASPQYKNTIRKEREWELGLVTEAALRRDAPLSEKPFYSYRLFRR